MPIQYKFSVQFWKHIIVKSVDWSFASCRKTQGEFDKCMKEKMNMDRPEPGFLSRVRLFESSRPKPAKDAPIKDYPTLPSPPTSIDEFPEAKDSLLRSKGGRLF